MPLTQMKRVLTLALFLTAFNFMSAQVGIGTTNPDTSSELDVASTDGGVLIPRMTYAQKTAIASPATGLLVYDTTNSCLSQNVGTPASPNWMCLRTEPATRFFYLPSINLDVTEGSHQVNLYNEYTAQFQNVAVKSTGAPSNIPVFAANELYYYVTAYDTDVLSALSITSAGVLSYTSAGNASECSFINVVLVVK